MKRTLLIVAGMAVVVGALTLPRFVTAPLSLHALFEKITQEEPVVLGIAGDMMFDRYIRQKAEQNGYDAIFANVSPLLSAHDMVIANLEGPITVFDSISIESTPRDQNNYTFTFSPHVAETLARANIHIVNLGNNHILNFGNHGVSQTKQFLADANIAYFGIPFSESAHIAEIRDVRVAFISFNEFVPVSLDDFVRYIVQMKNEADVLVVFSHWGYEYQNEPNTFQKERARAFIDAGADLVVGSHPHVIQTHETYNGKSIYYSLGNFVFDQYWNEEVRCGLFLTITINPKDFSYTVEETTVYLESDGTTVQKECRQTAQVTQSSPQILE